MQGQVRLPCEAVHCRVEVENKLRRRNHLASLVLQQNVRLNSERIGQGHHVWNDFAPLPTHANHPAGAGTVLQFDAPQDFAQVRPIPIEIDAATTVQVLHSLAQTPPFQKACLEGIPFANDTGED